MILSHRDLGSILQLEPNPVGHTLDERGSTADRDSSPVPKTEDGHGPTAFSEDRHLCFSSGSRIKDACPRSNAPTASHHQPPVPVAGRRDLVRLRTPPGGHTQRTQQISGPAADLGLFSEHLPSRGARWCWTRGVSRSTSGGADERSSLPRRHNAG